MYGKSILRHFYLKSNRISSILARYTDFHSSNIIHLRLEKSYFKV